MAGPLSGVRVVELGGIGPGPFGGMLLADLGADVIRVDRPAAGDGAPPGHLADVMGRGKRSITLDLKDPRDLETAAALIDRADVVVDPFRPGVAARLGLGPDACLERNPRLIYAHMTGWGQEEDRCRSREAGFNFHMVKPVDPAALKKLLAGLLLTPA